MPTAAAQRKHSSAERNGTGIDNRIEAVEESLEGLSRKERIEVKIGALLREVEAKNFAGQLKSFTALNHQWRTAMAQQLTEPVRKHLSANSPRFDPEKRAFWAQDKKLSDDKKAFAMQMTDDIFRLGLAFNFTEQPYNACYMTARGAEGQSKTGIYKLIKPGKNTPVLQTTEWDPLANLREGQLANRKERLSFVELVDAAAPGKDNALSPWQGR